MAWLIAALVLLLAGPSWFAGASTVGYLLLIPASIELVIEVGALVLLWSE